ncbi:MAG: hypothetical protein HDT15_03105 [Oscillibacter sp.]|nr:hypothetical protein [Oscillibacter sp.]MBD5154076.1 hypothetical protein [Oscillibacter sp.]
MEQTTQDPLRALFEGDYEPQISHHPMTEEERAIWDQAQTILGGEMIDKMVYAQSHSLAEEQYDYFCAGFRLGAQLMLELR